MTEGKEEAVSSQSAAAIWDQVTKALIGLGATLTGAMIIGAYGWMWNMSSTMQQKASAAEVQQLRTDLEVMKVDSTYLRQTLDEVKQDLKDARRSKSTSP